MEADIAAAVEALRVALARGGPGRRPIAALIQLIYGDGRSESLTLPGGSVAETVPASPAVQAVSEELTEHEQAVLRVLARAEKPLKSRAIGSRAGIRYSSHLREILTGLKSRGLIIIAPRGGYWAADRPLPDGS